MLASVSRDVSTYATSSLEDLRICGDLRSENGPSQDRGHEEKVRSIPPYTWHTTKYTLAMKFGESHGRLSHAHAS